MMTNFDQFFFMCMVVLSFLTVRSWSRFQKLRRAIRETKATREFYAYALLCVFFLTMSLFVQVYLDAGRIPLWIQFFLQSRLLFYGILAFVTGTLATFTFKYKDSTRSLIVLGIPALLLFIAGFFAPDVTTILERISGVQTPYLSISLAPKDNNNVQYQSTSIEAAPSAFSNDTDFLLGANSLVNLAQAAKRDKNFVEECMKLDDDVHIGVKSAKNEPELVSVIPADKNPDASTDKTLKDCPKKWESANLAKLVTSGEEYQNFINDTKLIDEWKPFFSCMYWYSTRYPDGLPIQDNLYHLSAPLVRTFLGQGEEDFVNATQDLGRIIIELKATFAAAKAASSASDKSDSRILNTYMMACNDIKSAENMVNTWRGSKRGAYGAIIASYIVTSSGYAKEGALIVIEYLDVENKSNGYRGISNESSMSYSPLSVMLEARLLEAASRLLQHVSEYETLVEALWRLSGAYKLILAQWSEKGKWGGHDTDIDLCSGEDYRRYYQALLTVENRYAYYVGRYRLSTLTNSARVSELQDLSDSIFARTASPKIIEGRDRKSVKLIECSAGNEDFISGIRLDGLLSYAYLDIALEQQYIKNGLTDTKDLVVHLRRAKIVLLETKNMTENLKDDTSAGQEAEQDGKAIVSLKTIALRNRYKTNTLKEIDNFLDELNNAARSQ